MDPLKPSFRDALKQEHPGLTDETIGRAEGLLAQRFLIDPEAEPLRPQQIDRERAELLRREMPKFEQVLQKVRGQPLTSPAAPSGTAPPS
ncbi:MAG: hypothetical protein U0797_05735 [Gemmataceae bacterium]